MLAIIRTGGKQYKVAPSQKIKIDKIEGEEGKEITLSDVLLVSDDKKTEIGAPKVKGAKVLATILKQGKGDKIIIFKYKSKKRYKIKKGFRPLYTQIEILKIQI